MTQSHSQEGRMRRISGFRLLLAASCLLLPSLASAQSQITGQVRDESGGVLPGVWKRPATS